jgi:hypothetical protein
MERFAEYDTQFNWMEERMEVLEQENNVPEGGLADPPQFLEGDGGPGVCSRLNTLVFNTDHTSRTITTSRVLAENIWQSKLDIVLLKDAGTLMVDKVRQSSIVLLWLGR